MLNNSHCPLCGAAAADDFHRDTRRSYLRCRECLLVFVPAQFRLSAAKEKAEYDQHRNDVNDSGYRGFLDRLATPLLGRLPVGSRGLDFGCGPGPALAAMLREAGMEMAVYDLFYMPDDSVLTAKYDFITATEVVEHLAKVGAELDRLWSLLHPGGVLGIMTKLVVDSVAFSEWHYKRDPTHICFFSRDTWSWWGRARGAELEILGADVMLLTKPSA
jgi:hypothetical protein